MRLGAWGNARIWVFERFYMGFLRDIGNRVELFYI